MSELKFLPSQAQLQALSLLETIISVDILKNNLLRLTFGGHNLIKWR